MTKPKTRGMLHAYLSSIGSIGGSKTSIRKKIACKKNGKKGGRPKKNFKRVCVSENLKYREGQ